MSILNLDSDNPNLVRWKIAAGMVLGALILFGIWGLQELWSGPNRREKVVAGSEGYKRMFQLCASLPVPEGVRLKDWDVAGNTQRYAVVYYLTPDDDFGQLAEFYRKWLEANGWTRFPDYQSRYFKEKQLISVDQIGGYYTVHCAESHCDGFDDENQQCFADS